MNSHSGESLFVTEPHVLAAATTVLGVMPLLQDIFWVAMSVTIMAGLTVVPYPRWSQFPCSTPSSTEFLPRAPNARG